MNVSDSFQSTQIMSEQNPPRLTTSAGAPVSSNETSMTAGRRGPVVLQDYKLFEKIAHQNRERIPERVVHAKGWGAHGTFTVTHDITQYNWKSHDLPAFYLFAVHLGAYTVMPPPEKSSNLRICSQV